jgi:3-methyladenine DNA glycosylase AlkC
VLIKADKKPTEKTTLAEATKKKLPEEKKLRAEKKSPKEGNTILELPT